MPAVKPRRPQGVPQRGNMNRALSHLSVACAICLAVECFYPCSVRADGEDRQPGTELSAGQPPVAARDPRLPPLLPGEQVNAGGNTMKMWSTSGPVPVGEPAQPFAGPNPTFGPNSQLPQGIGVIVDQRRKK